MLPLRHTRPTLSKVSRQGKPAAAAENAQPVKWRRYSGSVGSRESCTKSAPASLSPPLDKLSIKRRSEISPSFLERRSESSRSPGFLKRRSEISCSPDFLKRRSEISCSPGFLRRRSESSPGFLSMFIMIESGDSEASADWAQDMIKQPHKSPRKSSAGTAPAPKEDCMQTKRSPSSPQGGAKKRSAFGDITNANKNQQLLKKKNGQKAPVKKTKNVAAVNGVLRNNEINTKRALRKAPFSDVAVEVVIEKTISNEEDKPSVKEETCVEQLLPPDVEDIDKDSLDDPFSTAEYAMDIFTYMREREEKFVLCNYLESQADISKEMRAILVDWMVEVQENFELNHETLYLAVKLVDHYLAVKVIMREKLQLIGSTAVLIASKFEERCPPCLDDFLYICDDAYKREELTAMEMDVLQKLNFDINIPIPYRFLRRFGKCAHASMETLTLARYICELTLQDYQFVQESASKMAASCLLLALKMKDLGGWTATLQHYSGYRALDLLPLVKRLNFLIMCQPNEKLKAVRSKYSHRVFFEVAKLPPVDVLKLEESFQS